MHDLMPKLQAAPQSAQAMKCRFRRRIVIVEYARKSQTSIDKKPQSSGHGWKVMIPRKSRNSSPDLAENMSYCPSAINRITIYKFLLNAAYIGSTSRAT